MMNDSVVPVVLRHVRVFDGSGAALFPGEVRVEGERIAQVARGAERGLLHFEAWVTPFSLPVFERAGFRLVQRVKADFEGVAFERLRVER